MRVSQRFLAAAAITCALAARLCAQQGMVLAGGRSEVFAGSELETYLRTLQLIGVVPLYPWSVRSFSPRELDRLFPSDSAHPWAHHYDLAAPSSQRGRITLDLVRPTLSVRFNSGFPYGYNDGPIWAGRGLTSAVQAGFALRYGPLSLTVAPMVFRAENASFTLMANGDTGKFVYADGLHPGTIDRPQRFGNGPYAVIDVGQSTLRLDTGPLAAGVSTANQYWGPAAEYPAILGNNAAGFPHVFLGTAQPIDLWLFRFHGRLVWGRLSQSAFSPETTSAGIRLMTGLVGVMTSRWVPGLELGLSRFIHTPWPQRGPSLRDLLSPLHSHNLQNQVSLLHEDQLASVFARWVFPRSGVEVYGEYGREDYNADLRDLIDEPDHKGGYMASVGFRKVFVSSDTRLLVINGELQNQQLPRSAVELAPEQVYTHSPSPLQGHTQRGQILGSDLGPGGTGATIAMDWYSPRGRWSVRWTRVLRADRGTFLSAAQIDPRARDVDYALGVEGLLFRGRYDVLAGLTTVYEFNRNFTADAFNLNAVVGLRVDVTR